MITINPLTITASRFVLSPLFFFSHQLLLPYLKNKADTDVLAVTLMALLWLFFILIELSDIMDGKMARKRAQVTNSGKVLDPLADLFSKVTYFTCFIVSDIMPVWMFIVIIYRELAMVALRTLLAVAGLAFAARRHGKIKAFLYFIVSGLALLMYSLRLLLSIQPPLLSIFYTVVWSGFLIAAVVSWVSFISYIWAMHREGLFQKI